MKLDYPVLSLCANLEVSPSGYYDWQKRRTTPGARVLENQTLAKQIEAIHLQSRQTYGSPRIMDALRKQGCRHGRNRIARLMKAGSLCGRQQGRYRVRTTDSNHDQPIAPTQVWLGTSLLWRPRKTNSISNSSSEAVFVRENSVIASSASLSHFGFVWPDA